MHTVCCFFFLFFSELWLLLLGSWQFVLSKWYLPVPLPCPSLDVVQCRRSQTELSLRGIRGGKKWRSFPQMITRSHTVLQFSDYRDDETHTHKQEYAKSHTLKRNGKLRPHVSYIKVIPLTVSCGTS